MTRQHAYAFDSRSAEAETQLDALERYLDPITTARLAPLVAPGGTCWEIGAGGGSIAHWLVDAVGPTGRVVATDIAPDRIAGAPGLEVLAHDVVNEPVPGGPFDLIHARLVLLHLPERVAVLRRLVDSLVPGGWLVLEEFDCSAPLPVLTTPDAASAALFTRVTDAILSILTSAGADLAWAQRVHTAMAAAGLSDVDSRWHAESWDARSCGADLHETNSRQLREKLYPLGLDESDLTDFRRVVRDPAFASLSYLFVSARGRRPA